MDLNKRYCEICTNRCIYKPIFAYGVKYILCEDHKRRFSDEFEVNNKFRKIALLIYKQQKSKIEIFNMLRYPEKYLYNEKI